MSSGAWVLVGAALLGGVSLFLGATARTSSAAGDVWRVRFYVVFGALVAGLLVYGWLMQ